MSSERLKVSGLMPAVKVGLFRTATVGPEEPLMVDRKLGTRKGSQGRTQACICSMETNESKDFYSEKQLFYVFYNVNSFISLMIKILHASQGEKISCSPEK